MADYLNESAYSGTGFVIPSLTLISNRNITERVTNPFRLGIY